MTTDANVKCEFCKEWDAEFVVIRPTHEQENPSCSGCLAEAVNVVGSGFTCFVAPIVTTERLCKLSPRVTAADVESLVKATEEVQAIDRANANLRRELGLDERER
jgi:hypothetical protein